MSHHQVADQLLMSPPATRRSLAGVLLIAAAIRILGINSRPIWYDEAFAILFSETGPASMLRGTLSPTGIGASDVHPLGYYSALWLWMRAFGSSVIATRAFSVAAGLAIVGLVFILARRSFRTSTAGAAAFLAALLPFQVHYSQEIRMYALLAVTLTLAVYAYVRGSTGGATTWWLLFSVALAASAYVHHLAFVFMLPLAATPVIRREWRTAKAVALAAAAATVLYLPWLLQLPDQLTKVQNAYWIPAPGVDRLFALLLYYLPGQPLPPALLGPALFASLGVIALAAYASVSEWRSSTFVKSPSAWFLYLAFVPPALLWLISQAVPVYVERALLPSHVAFAIWLAWVLLEAPMLRAARLTTAAVVVVLAFVGVRTHLTYVDFPYGPFESLALSIGARSKSGDMIVHSNKLTLLPMIYYGRELPQVFIADAPGSPQDTLAPATQAVLGVTAITHIEQVERSGGRIWYVIFDRSIEEFARAGYDTHPDIAWLAQHYDAPEVEDWGSVDLYRYTPAPEEAGVNGLP